MEKPNRRPRASKCPHTDRSHASRGLCHSCYSTWRYRNFPEYREARLAYKNGWGKRKRRKANPEFKESDYIPLKEGIAYYRPIWTAQDEASLKACLKRRKLNMTRAEAMGKARSMELAMIRTLTLNENDWVDWDLIRAAA